MDPMMVSGALALGAASSVCVYLASPNQLLVPSSPLPARPMLGVGALLALASLGAWLAVMFPFPAFMAAMTWLSLGLVAMPHLGAAVAAARKAA